jgi:hypothetical protein
MVPGELAWSNLGTFCRNVPTFASGKGFFGTSPFPQTFDFPRYGGHPQPTRQGTWHFGTEGWGFESLRARFVSLLATTAYGEWPQSDVCEVKRFSQESPPASALNALNKKGHTGYVLRRACPFVVVDALPSG